MYYVISEFFKSENFVNTTSQEVNIAISPNLVCS